MGDGRPSEAAIRAVSIAPFRTHQDVVAFAKTFVRNHNGRFRKDVKICLTANEERNHAYFPALMTCISYLDFLSGLYAGKVKGHGLNELTQYAHDFMDRTHYSAGNLEILYKCFRHKVAHLGHPYTVFDSTKNDIAGPKQLITWTVYASDKVPPLEVEYCGRTKIKKATTPWDTYYDHRVRVRVRRLMIDAIKSTRGPNGYIRHVEQNTRAQDNFAACMRVIYPPEVKRTDAKQKLETLT